MAAPAIIAKNTPVQFSTITITGDVLYAEEHASLMLVDTQYGTRERLSVNLQAYGLAPKQGHVFIKDWSESHGVAASLAQAGIVEITGAYSVGNFRSTAYEARVLVQNI
ncbi:hypothetical protein ANMWB30_09580 [Arthrobacter sp. MWB30]|nr:hypothetical protein ANMWB30_09580 [Arthrobacter sp. MWB30]